jgi:DNA-entry nuclease
MKNIIKRSKLSIVALLLLLGVIFSTFTACDFLSDNNNSPSNTVNTPLGTQNGSGDNTDQSVENADLASNGTIDLSTIPAFSGTPYVKINNGEPTFSEAELTTKAYESYSPLDSLGRCGVAIATCGKETMPADGEERGEISSVYPSGWKQAKYDFVSGSYLYNRAHIIGWQLSAENANERNLITGTRYMNVDGMLPFENLVADYIDETGNHVAYRVTPIYNGKDLVCTGVQMEAYSIEDNGDGVCFNVFCYNVQPGVTINYATGASALSGEPLPDSSDKNESTGSTSSDTEQSYVLNTKTKKFHYPTCGSVNSISDANRSDVTDTRSDLVIQGYSPCGNCKP